MENQERQYVTFFLSYYNSIDKLPTEMQTPLYRAIARYSFFFEEPDFSGDSNENMLSALWEGILPNLRRSNKNYLNGKNGGAPKGSHNNPNGRAGTNPKQTENLANKKKEERNMKDKPSVGMELPYSSDKFKETWEELCTQPKWKNKTASALRKSLDKLARYEETFAIILMEDAIAGGWQGIEFNSTPAKYKQWKRTRIQEPTSIDGRRASRKVEI